MITQDGETRTKVRKEKTLDSLLAFVYDNTGNRNQVIDMEKIVRQGLLYDFYGELLTEHQRHVYEDVVFHDFSLSEIAQEQGITRQGVHDLVRRCDRILESYENKLHLVEKFLAVREKVERIDGIRKEYQTEDSDEWIQSIRRIAGEIIEEL